MDHVNDRLGHDNPGPSGRRVAACLEALQSLMNGSEVQGPDRHSLHTLQQAYAAMIA